MAAIIIGVEETAILRHEIEIKIEDTAGKKLAEIMNHIEKNGVEDIHEYVEGLKGCEVIDTFVSEVPDEEDVRYETWIVDAKQSN